MLEREQKRAQQRQRERGQGDGRGGPTATGGFELLVLLSEAFDQGRQGTDGAPLPAGWVDLGNFLEGLAAFWRQPAPPRLAGDEIAPGGDMRVLTPYPPWPTARAGAATFWSEHLGSQWVPAEPRTGRTVALRRDRQWPWLFRLICPRVLARSWAVTAEADELDMQSYTRLVRGLQVAYAMRPTDSTAGVSVSVASSCVAWLKNGLQTQALTQRCLRLPSSTSLSKSCCSTAEALQKRCRSAAPGGRATKRRSNPSSAGRGSCSAGATPA